MASFKTSARSLDQGVGTVLNALDETELADDTLVILTTDHGLAFPDAKATLTDRGLGVMLILRGPGGFHGGRVHDGLVSTCSPRCATRSPSSRRTGCRAGR
jgi:arylsulfatase A-like enzyme